MSRAKIVAPRALEKASLKPSQSAPAETLIRPYKGIKIHHNESRVPLVGTVGGGEVSRQAKLMKQDVHLMIGVKEKRLVLQAGLRPRFSAKHLSYKPAVPKSLTSARPTTTRASDRKRSD